MEGLTLFDEDFMCQKFDKIRAICVYKFIYL